MPTPLPRYRCTATKTELINGIPTVRRCTRCKGPEEHADGFHQWMRPGHRVRWPMSLQDARVAAYYRGYIAGLRFPDMEYPEILQQAKEDLS